MELITGSPNAEFGDKTSLVAQVTTRSGLGSGRVFGEVATTDGSFGTIGGSVGLGYGNAKVGNFLAVDGVRSGRFLDTPVINTLLVLTSFGGQSLHPERRVLSMEAAIHSPILRPHRTRTGNCSIGESRAIFPYHRDVTT